MDKAMASMDEIRRSIESDEAAYLKAVETIEPETDELDVMQLKNHPGWKALVKEKEEEIKGLDEKIHDIHNELTLEERMELLVKRYYLVKTIDAPVKAEETYNARTRERIPNEEF